MVSDLLNHSKIGLALSGGFVRTAASIGVIEALKNNKIYPGMISGSSSGALIAAAYACGKLSELKEILLNKIDWWKLFDLKISKYGFIAGVEIDDFLDNFFKGYCFENIKISLYIQTSDLNTQSEFYPRSGEIAPLVGAAMRIPGINPPFQYQGRNLVDGGTYSLLPTTILKENNSQIIIGVDNNLSPNLFTRGLYLARNRIKIVDRYLSTNVEYKDSVWQISKIALCQATRQYGNKDKNNKLADLIIKPELPGVGRYNVNNLNAIIESGKIITLAKIDQIRKLLID